MGQKPYILAFSPLYAQYVRVCFVVYSVLKKITTTLDCYFRKTVKIESFALHAGQTGSEIRPRTMSSVFMGACGLVDWETGHE